MITPYICPTCGYERAQWHIQLDNSAVLLCENCLPRFINCHSRICRFVLHKEKRRKAVLS